MKQFKHRFTALQEKRFGRYAMFVSGVVVFACLGTYLLMNSHAATPTAAYEAEAGTRSGNASLASDGGASGSSVVKFSSTASACPLSTPNVPDGSDPWGGCFPGPASTGYPHGLAGDTRTPVTLTIYTGPCTVTAANTVIDSKTINCDLEVQAANVTIKNSKVNGSVLVYTEDSAAANWSVTIQDSEVDKGTVQLAAVGAGNVTVLRSNIHGGEAGVQCEEKSVFCVVQDSYIHGQYIPPAGDWHLDGFLSDGGGNFRLTHNFIVCDSRSSSIGSGCTGDVNLIPNFGTAHDITVEYNLLGANTDASYCTYGGEKASTPYPHGNHIVYQHNIFQRGTNGLCGTYGVVTAFNYAGTGNVWTDNKFDDGTSILCDATHDCN